VRFVPVHPYKPGAGLTFIRVFSLSQHYHLEGDLVFRPEVNNRGT